MPPRKKHAPPSLVVAYYRVSTEEQGDSGAGLDAQQKSVHDDVQRRSWTLVAENTDIASGKTTDSRPGLAKSLEMIRKGEAGTLMVSKLDRLSRSLIDFATITGRAHREGWNLVALDLGVDLSTPSGEFLANVMASAAQWERRIIGLRTSEALQAKKAAGVILGRQPLLDPTIRKRIVTERRAGRTFDAIAADLNNDGIPTATGKSRWYRATIKSVIDSDTTERMTAANT